VSLWRGLEFGKRQKLGANTLKTANDKVFIKNLVLPCHVGVTQEERSKRQNVIVDVEIYCDLSQAAVTGDLKDSINYYEIKEKISSAVTNGEFKLLETLAETVASLALKEPAALRVGVAVKKEKYAKAPVMGIEVTRDRNG